MKNFVEKTKLELRHQELENSDLSPQAKFNRPVFLNNITSPKFPTGTLPTAANYSETPQNPDLVQENRFMAQKSIQSALETVRTNRYRSLIESKKTMIRRRSCCCQWCGGISSFEEKHQDIDSYIKKNERLSPQNSKPKYGRKHSKTEVKSPLKARFVVSSSDYVASIADGCTNSENMFKNEKIDKDNKKVTVTAPGTKARLSIALEDEDRNLKFSRTMTSYHKHSESSIGSEAKLEKKLEVWRNTLSKLRPGRQNSFTPIKLNKNSPFSSNFVNKNDKGHLRGESMESLPSMYKIMTIPENVGSPSHKMNMTQNNIKVIKTLIKDGYKYLPPSEDKIKQLTTPVSLVTLDKMRTTMLKYESAPKEIDKERKSPVSNETLIPKSSLSPPLKRKSPEEGNSPLLTKSSNALMLQISDQIKQKYISPKVETQKLSSILKTAQTKIHNIYIDEIGTLTLSRRTLSVLKSRSISTKSGIGSHLSTECSPIKSDHPGTISFKQAVKEINRESKSSFGRSKSNIRPKLREVNLSTQGQTRSGISGYKK